MSLLSKLQAKGVKTFQSSPLWEQTSIIETVQTGNDIVVIENTGDYSGYQLIIEEAEERAYIALKNNTQPDKEEYVIAEFTATRDWATYKIKKGDTKIFAV